MSKEKDINGPNNGEWLEIMAWGARAETKLMFEKVERHFFYGPRLPVDSERVATFGGVPLYLAHCEGEANFLRQLQALHIHHENAQKRLKEIG